MKKYDHQKIIEMYNAGKTEREIAKEIGIGHKYIRSILIRHGIIEAQHHIDKGKIKALHRAGWTAEEIAADMYIEAEQVREVLG